MKTPKKEHADLVKEIHHAILWGGIHRRAEQDLYLKEELDKIVVYYRLKYDCKNKETAST
jgi:hypothetical protein